MLRQNLPLMDCPSLVSHAWAASLHVSLVSVAKWPNVVAMCCTPCCIILGSKTGRSYAINSPWCCRRSSSARGGVSGGLAKGDASVATPFRVVLVQAACTQSNRRAHAASILSAVTAMDTTSQAWQGGRPWPKKRLM